MAKRSVAFLIVNGSARVLAALYILLLVFAWVNESVARQEPRMADTSPTGTAADWFYHWAIWTHAVPGLIALASVAIGWRWQAWGALGFGVLAILEIFSVGAEWAYLPLVAGPPALIAVLFLAAHFQRDNSGRSLSSQSSAPPAHDEGPTTTTVPPH